MLLLPFALSYQCDPERAENDAFAKPWRRPAAAYRDKIIFQRSLCDKLMRHAVVCVVQEICLFWYKKRPRKSAVRGLVFVLEEISATKLSFTRVVSMLTCLYRNLQKWLVAVRDYSKELPQLPPIRANFRVSAKEK